MTASNTLDKEKLMRRLEKLENEKIPQLKQEARELREMLEIGSLLSIDLSLETERQLQDLGYKWGCSAEEALVHCVSRIWAREGDYALRRARCHS